MADTRKSNSDELLESKEGSAHASMAALRANKSDESEGSLTSCAGTEASALLSMLETEEICALGAPCVGVDAISCWVLEYPALIRFAASSKGLGAITLKDLFLLVLAG